jgi:transcriptional regulator EpsA
MARSDFDCDMTHSTSLSGAELDGYARLIGQALEIRSHFDLLTWLQGDVQALLPHEVMLAGWGDFRLGLIAHDIVSPVPGVRTGRTSADTVSPLLSSMFQLWIERGRKPFALRAGDAGFVLDKGALEGDFGGAMRLMRTALVHGICDERGRHDCLYVLFSTRSLESASKCIAMRVLLPYLDTALRQVPLLRPDRAPDAAAEEAVAGNDTPLSEREIEIMTWVKLGKTNQEVGMILDISAFTVKNHLKRIFRKLDVFNRMQAVAKFESLSLNATH